MLPIVSIPDRPPSVAILFDVEPAQRKQDSHCCVKSFRQGMELRQHLNRLNNFKWKKTNQSWDDARELRITLAEIMRAVQLLQEKLRGLSVPAVFQQVIVGAREPLVLKGLDPANAGGKVKVGGLATSKPFHFAKVCQDSFTVKVAHVRVIMPQAPFTLHP